MLTLVKSLLMKGAELKALQFLIRRARDSMGSGSSFPHNLSPSCSKWRDLF